MDEPAVARLLRGAQLWALPTQGVEPRMVAGWEDEAPFCITVCTTDVGLNFCRRCPTGVASRALRARRAATARCKAGVRLLAFPAPRGVADQVAVLRVGRPSPREAVAVADQVRVSPVALRRAARRAEHLDGPAILAASRILRDPFTLHRWQAQQRDRASNRRRTATAALAQMITTSEEFHLLYRSSQHQRTELERQRRRLDRLARQSLRSQDIERARIAHQIHDTAAQSMVSAYRFVDAGRASAAAGKPDAADRHLESAAASLQASIAEIRAVLASLLPPGLEELGLGHSIEGWLSRLTAGTGVTCEVVGELPRLEGWVEQALYAMSVEAGSNAIRHANATKIQVELSVQRGRAVILIRDNGRGFDPARQGSRRGGEGLGLLGMRRQASWLGGQATIRSRPGAGTVVRLSVPIERNRAGASKVAAGSGRRSPAVPEAPARRAPREAAAPLGDAAPHATGAG
jgi:two-component system sensor histidine kinase DegS